ncbi:MAG: dockerin type I domain-containing protein [Bacteroidetes bacterium]|nr:dockerin type I domain-containing protein [Bacteroidota bacterium]
MKRFSQLNSHLPCAMNRIILLVVLILMGMGNLRSQNITGVEYFFDTDPGFGAGNSIPVVVPAPNLSSFNHSISVSGLPNGFHRLFIRARDENGRWSHTKYQAFLKTTVVVTSAEIVTAEYFIDTDPGMGNGTLIPVTPSSPNAELSFNIDISNLPQGIHQLFVRTKDQYGHWSHSQKRAFLREIVILPATIVIAAEYFIDTDPGFGGGASIPINPSANLTLDANIDITGFSPGFHNIFIRVKDNYGRWSLTHKRAFLNESIVIGNPKVQGLEYFIDTDPGFGQGQPIPVTPAVNLTSVNHVIDISQLNTGFHKLFIRARDDKGCWSLTQFRNFLKQLVPVSNNKVAEAEYFIDSDPGFGNGNQVDISPDTSQAELSFIVDLTNVPDGFHKLFVRTRDDENHWSHTKFQAFYKNQTGPDSLPNLVYAEYFLDTDPGTGNGHSISFNPVQNIPFVAFQLDLAGVEFGQHFLYVRTKDAFGKWSLTTRDTIFYYLDSLPTAVLNGPPGFCQNVAGEFEVNLTGTPPWTLVINNGFTVDTIYNILTSPYIFTVNPASAGAKTAKVIKVQDVYYTGLYTGIPIEYEVHPLPATAGTIQGPQVLCKGSGQNWYWINPVAYATSYSWTLPAGAVITNGQNSSSVNINFSDVTGSGSIQVYPVNGCGQGTPSSLYVEIKPLPVVNAGPDVYIPYQDTTLLNPTITGGSDPYSFSWSPWYYVGNAYTQQTLAFPAVTTAFTLNVTDLYGCQAQDQVTVFVGAIPGVTLTGIFTYKNNLNTPMNGSTVFLKQGNIVVDSTTTGTFGEYSLTDIAEGSYTLSGRTTKPWGGVNASDALLVMKHFAGLAFLTGLNIQAADVDKSGYINAADALNIARRYTGIINIFVAGDWVADKKNLSVPASGSMNGNLQALVVGDVNESYIPEARLSREVELERKGWFNLPPGNETEIPVILEQDLQLGAVSLALDIPKGITVEDVLNQNHLQATDPIVFNNNGNQLRVAWYSLNPIQIRSGEVLFWLKIRYSANCSDDWRISNESSLADGMGQTLSPVTVIIPRLQHFSNSFSLGENAPNPFSTNTVIQFTLPDDCKVNLKICNSLGQEISTLVQEPLAAGTHNILFEGGTLLSGIYYCILTAQTGTDQYSAVRKLVLNR